MSSFFYIDGMNLSVFINVIIKHYALLQEEESVDGVFYVICIALAIIFGLTVLLTIQHFQIIKWKKGFFPDMKYSSDNLLKAYVSLAGLMIRVNSEQSNAKFYFAISYFDKKFPNSNLDFKYLLSFSLRYPIQKRMVCIWLNKHLEEDIYRLQLIYFLTGLSMVDGKVVISEYKFLLTTVGLLNLKVSDFNSILAAYLDSSQQKSNKSKESNYSLDLKLKNAYKVLGFNEKVGFNEVKKAYRKLVMKHHPDRFANQGVDQIEMAKSHFIKIQQAYEFLEKKIN